MKKIMLTATILFATTAVMAGGKEAKPYQDRVAKLSKMFKEAKKQGALCPAGCVRVGKYCICP
jgi:sulfur relay (sulfurtransferase) complex TusBCD TusD component (DsrE family)